jgi:hypothetical protein
MPICGHPTKSGKTCKRQSPYCWQHRASRWRTVGKWFAGTLAFMTFVSFASVFVEIPRHKFGSSEIASKQVPEAPKDLKVLATDTPARPLPSQRIFAAHSATPKAAAAADVSQPTSAPIGIATQQALPQSVGLTETNLATDSVTAILNRQLTSDISDSRQTPTLTSVSLAAFSKSLTEANEPSLDLSATQELSNPTLFRFSDLGKPASVFSEPQQQTSISLTTAQQAAALISGFQQISSLGTPIVSPDSHGAPQILNPVVQ